MRRTKSGGPGLQPRALLPGTKAPNTRCKNCGGNYYSASRKTDLCALCRDSGDERRQEPKSASVEPEGDGATLASIFPLGPTAYRGQLKQEYVGYLLDSETRSSLQLLFHLPVEGGDEKGVKTFGTEMMVDDVPSGVLEFHFIEFSGVVYCDLPYFRLLLTPDGGAMHGFMRRGSSYVTVRVWEAKSVDDHADPPPPEELKGRYIGALTEVLNGWGVEPIQWTLELTFEIPPEISPQVDFPGRVAWHLNKASEPILRRARHAEAPVEIVSCQYDNFRGRVLMHGVALEDPDDLLAMSQYHLVLTPDGSLYGVAEANEWTSAFRCSWADEALTKGCLGR
mmetsp:Transcript_60563/g.143196  ORF Transcript_60563/g.143196 Transcript_60563/m.143196 type:complete len:338 (-) Transcript_60563:97-1110(-)